MHKFISNVALFFVISGLVVLQGCGGNSLGTVPVSGTVTLDGNSISGVTVSFAPTGTEGREAYGTTDTGGRFVLTVPGTTTGSGTVPAEYRVTFSKMSDPLEGVDTSGMDSDEADAEIRRRFPRGLPVAVSLIPDKYSDRTATDIAPVTVERRGKNNFTFELKSQ